MFGNIFKVYLVFDKVFNTEWHNLYAFGQTFIAVNGQVLKLQSDHLVMLIVAFNVNATKDVNPNEAQNRSIDPSRKKHSN